MDSFRNKNEMARKVMGSSVPVRVKGLTWNVLLDSSGEFDEEGRLMDMLTKPR